MTTEHANAWEAWAAADRSVVLPGTSTTRKKIMKDRADVTIEFRPIAAQGRHDEEQIVDQDPIILDGTLILRCEEWTWMYPMEIIWKVTVRKHEVEEEGDHV